MQMLRGVDTFSGAPRCRRRELVLRLAACLPPVAKYKIRPSRIAVHDMVLSR